MNMHASASTQLVTRQPHAIANARVSHFAAAFHVLWAQISGLGQLIDRSHRVRWRAITSSAKSGANEIRAMEDEHDVCMAVLS